MNSFFIADTKEKRIKMNLSDLSSNPNAIYLLERNPEKINIKRDFSRLFEYLCKTGDLEPAQHLISIKPEIDENTCFITACENGRLELAQLLLSWKPTIVISAWIDDAFRLAFENGHLQVAQWLLSIKPDIDVFAYDDGAFRTVCENGHLEFAQWLCSLYPERYIITSIHRITLFIPFANIPFTQIQYKIHKSLRMHSEPYLVNKTETCPVCSENPCEISTCCNHNYCTKCIQAWLDINSTCPYCRTNLSNTMFRSVQVSTI